MVMGAQKNCLIETILLITHKMFGLRNKKNDFPLCLLIRRPAYRLFTQGHRFFMEGILAVLILLMDKEGHVQT